MTLNHLKFIFRSVINQETYLDSDITPWIDEDGRIYATNGFLVLCLENKQGRDKGFVDNRFPHLNVKGLIPAFNEDIKADYYIKLDTLENFKGDGDLAGASISDRNAKKIAKTLRLFGMEGVTFSKTDRNNLLFFIPDNAGITGMLLCGYSNAETNVTIPFQDLKQMKSYPVDASVFNELGQKYFQNCIRQDMEYRAHHQNEIEDANERDNYKSFYEITITRSKKICVRAANKAEAEDIAINTCNIDFDGDNEVEDCEFSIMDDCRDVYDKYYDAEGPHNWKDKEE